MQADRFQETADKFYVTHGPCCAGCDWWHSASSVIGECHRSAPVSAEQRHRMVAPMWNTINFGKSEPGHLLTRREHRCGDFKDEFDWSTLPAYYLRRIGKTVGITARDSGKGAA